MGWLDLNPAAVQHILITHQDTDYVGAVETDSDGLFRSTTLYIGEEENRYLTGEKRRRVIWGLYKLPMVKIENKKVLLKDGQVFAIGDIKIECFLVPGHTWGHLVYIIDDRYLFTGDTIWFGPNGGRSFINMLAEDNVSQKISDARFAKMSQRYEQEQGENAKRIKVLRLELKKSEGQRLDVDISLQRSGGTPTPRRLHSAW